ncbi:universal stress protein [bacterium]|nr:universal stress protein [bacterium]
MFRHILVPLENSPTDETMLAYIPRLCRSMGARVTLIHVADGFAARYQESLNLAASEEMRQDWKYLEDKAAELRAGGCDVATHLAGGEPSKEIVAYAEANGHDLIAMCTHGHKLLGDLIHGSVVYGVRHETEIPILLIRDKKL